MCLVITALGAAVWFYFLPYLTVRHINTTIEHGDIDALSRAIDFPTLRANLKEQLNFLAADQMMKGDPQHSDLMLRKSHLYELIDAYVTPIGIHQLAGDGHDLLSRYHMSCAYDSASQFSVRIKEAEGAKVILTRSGFGWRLTNIFLVDVVRGWLGEKSSLGLPISKPSPGPTKTP